MDISPWQMIASVFGGGAGGSAITSAFGWLNKHQRSQAYTMGAVDHAVQTAMASVTGQLERTETRLQAVEDQHAECERNLALVRLDLESSKRDATQERQELLAQIDSLMNGRVAAIGEAAPS